MTEPVMMRDSSPIIAKARVRFKCRSLLVKLREIYLILIEVPHLKQRLKATNFMSVFDCKIWNGDNQVILAMIEHWWPTTHTFHLPCGKLGITPRDFTVLTGIGVLFGNSKSWARLELLCPITVLENNAYTIDFGSAILGHLYYCLDQASKQKVKYISGLFQLIEYHCYEYCQIGHHILIDNRLDDFWPRMSAWQTKRRKVAGNKVKHHLALMRQQLDLRTINNMQWDPFRNMKDALKRERVVGHHVDYDAYWRHVSHGALMSDIVRTLDLEARHLHDESRITHLTVDLRRIEGHLSQLNDYLDGKGIVVDWEDEAGTSQAGTSRGRGSQGRGSWGRTYE
ncbi:hypothetical protein GIB67_011364, partial [Kingdonia uniflora]